MLRRIRLTICNPLYVLIFITWLGGAMWVAKQPGFNGWDALIWLYYVGRFIAIHFTALTI